MPTTQNSLNDDIVVVDDVATNATMYPVFVAATSANVPTYVSSTLLTWNPATKTFSAPIVNGGTAATSSLTLQSTTGAGASDSIIFNTGSQVEAARFTTSGDYLDQAGMNFITPWGGFGRHHNWLTSPEIPNAAVWTQAAIASNSQDTISPAGVPNQAYTVTADGTAGPHTVSQPAVFSPDPSSLTWTFSVWLKVASGTKTVNLRIDTGSTTGTALPVTVTTAWQRFSVTQAFGAAQTGTATGFIILGTSDAINIWGAQLEKASNPGTYGLVASGGDTFGFFVAGQTVLSSRPATAGSQPLALNVAPQASTGLAVSGGAVAQIAGSTFTHNADSMSFNLFVIASSTFAQSSAHTYNNVTSLSITRSTFDTTNVTSQNRFDLFITGNTTAATSATAQVCGLVVGGNTQTYVGTTAMTAVSSGGAYSGITIYSNTLTDASSVTMSLATGGFFGVPTVGGSLAITEVNAIRTGVANTQVSAAAFKYVGGLNVAAHTVTLTGTTHVTTTSAASAASLDVITLTDVSAVTVDSAATLFIAGAPAAAGSVTLTNSYAFWVDGGTTRLDGPQIISRNPQAGDYVITTTDFYVGVTSTAAPRALTLPAANAMTAGRVLVIKDESGACATNNITVSRAGADTIDGATTFVMNVNYMSINLVSDGSSKWFVW